MRGKILLTLSLYTLLGILIFSNFDFYREVIKKFMQETQVSQVHQDHLEEDK